MSLRHFSACNGLISSFMLCYWDGEFVFAGFVRSNFLRTCACCKWRHLQFEGKIFSWLVNSLAPERSIHIHFRLRCCPCPIQWGNFTYFLFHIHFSDLKFPLKSLSRECHWTSQTSCMCVLFARLNKLIEWISINCLFKIPTFALNDIPWWLIPSN